jgi:signal transduction histidine kinase
VEALGPREGFQLLPAIQDFRGTRGENQMAQSDASEFFCYGGRDHSIMVGGTEGLQSTGASWGDMTNPEKNPNAPQVTQGSPAARALRHSEIPLVDQLTRINSELVNGQRQLAKKHAELQKVSTEKSQMLGMVAHDLRNPLSGILNATEYVLEDAAGLLGENDLALLQAIESTSRFMLRLIDDMVEISAIESGKLQLDRKPTDIISLIEQVLSLTRPMAERKQIGIDVTASSELPQVRVDSTKMYRVIDNLVTNAIKFSGPGGRVRIRVYPNDGFVKVSVQDQGPGIPAHELKAVFKLFHKGRLASASKAAGTGLGLAISKRIVEAHGGELLLESKVGKGSTLTVSLPASATAGQQVLHRARRPSQARRSIASSVA